MVVIVPLTRGVTSVPLGRMISCRNTLSIAMKSLESKSKYRKAKKPSEIKSCDSGLRSSSGDLSATPSGPADLGAVAGVSEARIVDLIFGQISYLSSSFAASMEASFVQIEALIDSKISRHVSQDVSDPSFSAPSPVLVSLSPG